MEDSQPRASEPASAMQRCALEEKIRSKEQQLASLFHREQEITTQMESSRLKHQRLMERSILLQKRRLQLRAVFVRQKMFYREIQDSLVKSRERLATLSMLESTAAQETINPPPSPRDCKIPANNEKPVCDVECVEKEFDSLPGESSRVMPTIDIHDVSMFHELRNKNMSRKSASYNFLLPAIKPPLMEKILTLVMSEANAMDIDITADSTRRRFIRNTCLDFTQLVATETSKRTANNSHAAIASEQRTEVDEGCNNDSWDPHGTLCPYEVSGVCADDYCPYQHFSKATKPKELIPLPPIRTTLLQATHTNPDNQLHHPAPSDSVQPKNESSDNDLDTQRSSSDEMEEDFISLPVAEDTKDSTIEAVPSNNQTGCKIQRIELEWGASLDFTFLPIDKTIESWIEESGGSLLNPNQRLRLFAGLIDSIRLSIHAGRFDLALKASLSCVAWNRDKPAWLVSIAQRLQATANNAFVSRGGGSLSFVRSQFTNQASLAFLSLHLSLACSSIGYGNAAQPRTPLFHDAVLACIDSLLESEASTDFVTTKPVDDLKVVLSSIVSVSTNESTEDTSIVIRDRFIVLKVAMEWIQKNINPSTIRESMVHERRLHDLFDSFRTCLSKKEDYDQINFVSVVVLFGLATLGILEYLSAEASERDPPPPSLASDLAVWTGVISDTLRSLSKGNSNLEKMPFLDLLLAPLHAAIVSANVFLRQYDRAFNHLQDRLSQEITHTRPTSLLQFSELLWSQFLQLRMALPSGNVNTIPAKGEKGKVKSKEFQWALSKAVTADNWRLVAKLEYLGIYLHHISLWGDSILLQAWNGPPSEKETSLSQILSLIFQSGQPSTSLQLSLDLAPEEEPPSNQKVDSQISRVPLSLLLAGETLLDLNLSGCSLGALPPSFGLYFPKLISLDISKNQLISIPLSFHRMICLCTLNVSYNRLTKLSGEELMASLTVFDLSHNHLTTAAATAAAAAAATDATMEMESNADSSDSTCGTAGNDFSLFVVTLIRRCFQLQVLNISWNELSEEELEQTMVPHWVLHLKQLRVLTTHPQRANLKSSVLSTNEG
eukprot:Nitzschia sp. Nitz4//scaffold208_size52459//1522//4915//NITZ4_006804-RA/size52459-augustus-gene-0.5-mRNA-1//-1//CDS//3329541633//7071//frame0